MSIKSRLTLAAAAAVALLAPAAPGVAQLAPVDAQEARLGPCYARWTGDELIVGNAHVERRWRVENGLLWATSLRDKTRNAEWLARPATLSAPVPARALPDETRVVRFAAQVGAAGPTQAEALNIAIEAEGPGARLTHRLQVFEGAAGVTLELDAVWPGAPAPDGSAAPAETTDVLEQLDLAPAHLALTQVTLVDQTDAHDELVFERAWLLHPSESDLVLEGNLFVVEDPLARAGLIFLKLAPLPHARPVSGGADLLVHTKGMDLRNLQNLREGAGAAQPSGYRFVLRGQGTGPDGGRGYRHVALAYTGGAAGRTAALHAYQRQLRRFDPARDGRFLSNTWGDRSRDARIREDFIRDEIAAAARLGVDVVQIDDGWQKGRSKNSASGPGAWNDFWATDPEFWLPDPQRFPHGLAPLVQEASGQGVRLGLWFAPDSSHDFANWERDAERLLDLHRNAGIDYFKIDAVNAVTRPGELNLHRFLDRVLGESRGRVAFDLDVTAEVRPGYFGAVEAGPLFVENRYTDWHRYWPHHTLRNLWILAHYVDPLRLRMELLNNSRNADLYANDPLAPARYRPAYLFATTMFANPLGWFEVSNLPPAYVAEVAPLVAIWKAHRQEIHAGQILPIGERPDGTSWTGFASVQADRRSAWVVVFREENGRSEWSVELPLLAPGSYHARHLAGAGTATYAAGRLRVRLPEPRSFALLQVRPTPPGGRAR